MLLPGLLLGIAAGRKHRSHAARPLHSAPASASAVWQTWSRLGRRIVALMLLGLLLWAWLADGAGLLALAVCHGAAWSLAWAGSMLAPGRTDAGGQATSPAQPRWWPWLAPALAPLLLLLFGAAVARWGATALVATHLGLTLWALAGVVAGAVDGAAGWGPRSGPTEPAAAERDSSMKRFCAAPGSSSLPVHRARRLDTFRTAVVPVPATWRNRQP
jgi:hypothetical protein